MRTALNVLLWIGVLVTVAVTLDAQLTDGGHVQIENVSREVTAQRFALSTDGRAPNPFTRFAPHSADVFLPNLIGHANRVFSRQMRPLTEDQELLNAINESQSKLASILVFATVFNRSLAAIESGKHTEVNLSLIRTHCEASLKRDVAEARLAIERITIILRLRKVNLDNALAHPTIIKATIALHATSAGQRFLFSSLNQGALSTLFTLGGMRDAAIRNLIRLFRVATSYR